MININVVQLKQCLDIQVVLIHYTVIQMLLNQILVKIMNGENIKMLNKQEFIHFLVFYLIMMEVDLNTLMILIHT